MRQECDSNGNFPWGNGSKRQEDDFPSCLHRNDSSSMKTIIARSQEASMEPPIAEDIIAIVSAIPSMIVT